jgi:hypothetical protein
MLNLFISNNKIKVYLKEFYRLRVRFLLFIEDQ